MIPPEMITAFFVVGTICWFFTIFIDPHIRSWYEERKRKTK